MKPLLSCLAGSLLLLSSLAAEAAVIGYRLEVTGVGSGPLVGLIAEGGVYWDGDIDLGDYAVLSREAGADITHVDPSVGLSFDIGPYVFTEADAWSPPVFTFLGGVLQSISYIVTQSSTTFDLAAFGVDMFTFDIFRRPDGGPPVTFDGNTYGVNAIIKPLAPVPLPAGLPLLAGGLGLLVFLRRRKSA